MEPTTPMAPPDLDVIAEDVTIHVEGLPNYAPALIINYGHGALVEQRTVDGPGPYYPTLADGTIVRVQWDPTVPAGPYGDAPGAWTMTLGLSGIGLLGADVIAAGHTDDWPNRTQVFVSRGERLRPSHLEPASPTAIHQWRHRAHVLRTCRAARWWPALADEYDGLLPDGYEIVWNENVGGDTPASWEIVGSGLVPPSLPLTDGLFIVIEDGGGPITVATQRQLIMSWAQITGPDLPTSAALT